MGHHFRKIATNDTRTKYAVYEYEDLGLFHNTLALGGRYGKKKEFGPGCVPLWLKTFSYIHATCQSSYIGYKYPYLAWLSTRDLIALNPQLVVRVWRNAEDTIGSMLRKRGRSLEYWTRVYESGEENLDRLEQESGIKFVTIKTPGKNESPIKDVEIEEQLKPHIAELSSERRLVDSNQSSKPANNSSNDQTP